MRQRLAAIWLLLSESRPEGTPTTVTVPAASVTQVTVASDPSPVTVSTETPTTVTVETPW